MDGLRFTKRFRAADFGVSHLQGLQVPLVCAPQLLGARLRLRARRRQRVRLLHPRRLQRLPQRRVLRRQRLPRLGRRRRELLLSRALRRRQRRVPVRRQLAARRLGLLQFARPLLLRLQRARCCQTPAAAVGAPPCLGVTFWYNSVV